MERIKRHSTVIELFLLFATVAVAAVGIWASMRQVQISDRQSDISDTQTALSGTQTALSGTQTALTQQQFRPVFDFQFNGPLTSGPVGNNELSLRVYNVGGSVPSLYIEVYTFLAVEDPLETESSASFLIPVDNYFERRFATVIDSRNEVAFLNDELKPSCDEAFGDLRGEIQESAIKDPEEEFLTDLDLVVFVRVEYTDSLDESGMQWFRLSDFGQFRLSQDQASSVISQFNDRSRWVEGNARPERVDFTSASPQIIWDIYKARDS